MLDHLPGFPDDYSSCHGPLSSVSSSLSSTAAELCHERPRERSLYVTLLGWIVTMLRTEESRVHNVRSRSVATGHVCVATLLHASMVLQLEAE